MNSLPAPLINDPVNARHPEPVWSRASKVVAVFIASLTFAASSCAARGPGLTLSDSAVSDADYTFLIPLGTGELIDAGVEIEILPARLDVKVGETIHINNEDDRGHLVGPFFVGPNEKLSQRFTSVGELIGECSVHPSGELTVSVTQ